MPDGKQWLRRLQVNRVALVDRGANQKADAVLWKRQEPDPDLADVHQGGQEYWHRQFSADQRQAMASRGQAMSGGGFPIANEQDLRNAIQAVGRASDPAAAKAHIISRARALGLTNLLPDGWVGKILDLDEIEKAGRAISASRLKELMASRDSLTRLIEEAQPATPREEDHMPDEKVALSDEARKALPEDAQKFITDLEGQVAKAAKPADDKPEDEVLKGLPEDVRKRIEAVEKRAEDAENAAKEEREKRETAEVTKRLESTKHAGVNTAEWAAPMRKLAETDPEFAKKVEETLNAASERIRQAELFGELGKRTSEFGASGAYEKLQKMAQEKAQASNIPEDQAFSEVLDTPEGRRLYAEYNEDAKGGVS